MEFQETSLYNRDLVKFLKDYREEWNISRQVLAEEIGVSSVFNWEKGGVVGSNSMRLIKEYFCLDFSIKYAYYTADGNLMFEGPKDLFIKYLGITETRYYHLLKDGLVIKRDLPVSDIETDLYKTYKVAPNSINLNNRKVYGAYKDGHLLAQGSLTEIAEQLKVSFNHIKWLKTMTHKEKHDRFIKIHHIGYQFNEDLGDVTC